MGITSVTTIVMVPEDDPFYEILGRTTTSTSHTNDPFDWEKTWYMWLIFLIFCCIFEYKLFGDKKKKDKELEGV